MRKVSLLLAAMGLAAVLSACTKYETGFITDHNCSGGGGIYVPDFCAEYTSGNF